jgi:hypothetical protein
MQMRQSTLKQSAELTLVREQTYLGTATGGVRADGRKKLESRPPVFLRGGSLAEKDLVTVGWAGEESLVVLVRRTGRVAM